ncbi:hypothetical protein [Nocardia africana]|uniref:Uncharacterized protein n=1 Tax=Nocardia africana TaxID=134964 RepID=A0ABW6NPK9_9NOCA
MGDRGWEIVRPREAAHGLAMLGYRDCADAGMELRGGGDSGGDRGG